MESNPSNKDTTARDESTGASAAAPGLSGVGSTTGAQESVGVLAPALNFGIKLLLACTVGYVIVHGFNNRFIAMDYRRDLDPANIGDDQARQKADQIDEAIRWYGDDFDDVADAFSNPTLNYNGFVRLYNAFGHRDDKNLIEKIRDNFSDYDVRRLGMLTGGAFF